MHEAATPSDATLKQQLTRVVLDRGYDRRDEPFQLSSGGFSRDYVDLRRAVSRGPDLEVAAWALKAALDDAGISYDVLGGMTMGADPVAHAVALLTGGAWYSVRKQVKGHGTGRRVEGATVGPGVRAVVIEDTVSTGRSLLEALEVIADTGAEVVAAATLLDRGDTMAPECARRGVKYVAVLTYEDVGLEPIGAPAPGAADG